MSSKVYNFLRWFSAIFLPALTTFVGAVLTALNVENAETILTIMVGFTTFMNTIVGINKVSYDKKMQAKLSDSAQTPNNNEEHKKEE